MAKIIIIPVENSIHQAVVAILEKSKLIEINIIKGNLQIQLDRLRLWIEIVEIKDPRKTKIICNNSNNNNCSNTCHSETDQLMQRPWQPLLRINEILYRHCNIASLWINCKLIWIKHLLLIHYFSQNVFQNRIIILEGTVLGVMKGVWTKIISKMRQHLRVAQ